MEAITGPDLCHCLAARRGSRMLSRIYDRHLAPTGVNISQFTLLSFLAQNPGMGTAELASEMVMDRTTLVRALKPLRAAGLVEGARGGGSDLRYRLTPEGVKIHKRARPMWRAAQADYESLFGAERAADLRGELLAMTSRA